MFDDPTVYGHCIRRRYIGLQMPKYQRELSIRRIFAEKDVADAISSIKNRMRMLMLMCLDADELIKKRQQRDRHTRNLPKPFLIFLLVMIGVAGLVVLLMFLHFCSFFLYLT